MFDRNKFAQILSRIAEQYSSITDMANTLDLDRSYLSKYINGRAINPPKPNTLQKIADNSFNITNYHELMSTCGYEEMTDEYNLLINGDIKYADLYFDGQNLQNDEKIKEIEKLIKNLENYVKSCETMIQTNQDNTFGDYYINLYKSDLERAEKEITGFTKILKQLKNNCNK